MNLNPAPIGNRSPEFASNSRTRLFALRTFSAIVLAIFCLVEPTTTRAAGIVLQKIDPAEGCVDQPIKLTGDNMPKCRRVHFLVGRTTRTAKFKVLSNTELEVIVPEYYRANAVAAILIEADDGITFTCPTNETVVQQNQPNLNLGGHDKNNLLHVIQGGVVQRSSRMTVIEKGGVVGTIDQHCPLVLVKNGGILAEVESHSSTNTTIFYEPAAQLGTSILNLKKGQVLTIPVKEINLAEGIGPFIFQPAEADLTLGASDAPAQMTGFSPAIVSNGEILTIRGKGFSDTQSVSLVTHAAVTAGFRVISDTELRVEVPEAISGHHELMIVNSKGLTITHTPVPGPHPQNGVTRGVKWIDVSAGTLLTGEELRQESQTPIIIVEKGGTLMNRHVPALCLVKSGGTLVESIGETYYEPGASIPAPLNRSKPVASIQIVKLNTPLDITPLGSRP